MKSLLFALASLLVCPAQTCAGDWQELRASDGKVVQLAAEFRLESIRIDTQGDATFQALAVIDGAPAGLQLRVNQAQSGTVPRGNHQSDLAVMRFDLEVCSLGEATRRLEEFLNRRLQTREPTRVTGLYAGLGWELAASLESPAFILAGSVGLATDEAGKRIEAENFSLTLFLDLPLKRATIYFHERGGYGGTAAAQAARRQWLEAAKRSPAATPNKK